MIHFPSTTALSVCCFFTIATYLHAQPEGPYGPIQQSYPVPDAGAILFAAPDGQGTACTLEEPCDAGYALQNAPSGATVIFRGGAYRTGGINFNKRITLQPYLDETPVFKGSNVAAEWSSSSGRWTTSWSTLFPRSAPSWNDPETTPPCLWNRDMVLMDDTPLVQVCSADELAPGKFFVDYANQRITIADNPAGKTVEITAREFGMKRVSGSVNGKGADTQGPVVRGLTFKHYAYEGFDIAVNQPSENVPYNTFGADVRNSLIENNRFIRNGQRGCRLGGDAIIVRNNEIGYNAFVGVDLNSANGALFEGNHIHHNNYQRILNFPAGLKIFNQIDSVTVRNNLVEENVGNGIWYDVGNTNGIVVHNLVRNNTKSGIMFEISSRCIIAGNVVINGPDARQGIYALHASYVSIFNNTITGARSTIDISRSDRTAGNDPFGWHASTGPLLGNYEHHRVANNIMSQPYDSYTVLDIVETTAGCGKDDDVQVDLFDNNAYYRPAENGPSNLLRWSPHPDGSCTKGYQSLAGFREVFPEFEISSIDVVNEANPFFINPAEEDFRLREGSPALGAGMPLPSEVAEALGWSTGGPVDMGAFQGVASAVEDWAERHYPEKRISLQSINGSQVLRIRIPGHETSARLVIFTPSGQAVHASLISGGESFTDVGFLKGGLYLVKVESSACKSCQVILFPCI